MSPSSVVFYGCSAKGGLSPRAHSDKTPSKPRPLPILGLLDPRTATDTAATARSFRMRPSAWICVDPSRSKLAGTEMQRFLEQGASAWRRTIIVEVSQFAPPVTGAITSASRTTETASAALAARLRRVVAKRHALPTINLGSLLKPENVPPAGLCWTSAPCRMVLI